MWTKYFTSSNKVKAFRKSFGEPDIIQVRKVFNLRQDAILFEQKVLKRINAAKREDFLNVAVSKAIPLELSTHYGLFNGMFGKKHSEHTKNKMRGLKPLITKLRMSESAKLRCIGEDRTGKNNPAFKGLIKTPYGLFESLKAAATAEPNKTHFSTISLRVNNSSNTEYVRVM